MTKVAAIIPARYSSNRFPGKVIVPIAGKPMIQRVWERTQKARNVELAVIATDDHRVREAAESFGAKVIMTSAEHGSGTERAAEAAEKLNADVIVNVQGDEPLISPDSLDMLVRPFFEEDNISVSSLMYPIHSYQDFLNPNIVKVVCDETGFAIYFSRAAIPYYREDRDLLQAWREKDQRPEMLLPAPMKHIGVYAYRENFLQALVRMPRSNHENAERLEQLRILAWGFRIRMIETPYDSTGVDVPEDVEKVEQLIREQENP